MQGQRNEPTGGRGRRCWGRSLCSRDCLAGQVAVADGGEFGLLVRRLNAKKASTLKRKTPVSSNSASVSGLWVSLISQINPAVGHFLIIAKLEEHDIRAPILRISRVVAI